MMMNKNEIYSLTKKNAKKQTSKNERNPDSLVYIPGFPPLIAGSPISVKFGLANVNDRPILLSYTHL